MRPCLCDKLETCRLCYLYHNPDDVPAYRGYREAWDKPAATPQEPQPATNLKQVGRLKPVGPRKELPKKDCGCGKTASGN